MLIFFRGRVIADDYEQTSVPNIYAVGDILQGKPELTPVAIQAGKLLAKRLYAGATEKTDYINVPTTVFTPLEYGSCGYSEEAAMEKFGEDKIEVYHTNFQPLEYTVAERDSNDCYAKILCNKADDVSVPLSYWVCQENFPLLKSHSTKSISWIGMNRILLRSSI
eukprot:Seg618.2 transcript_id=Seg618.2/GoldUCD/mRNA.D3Y31 product="Thioredoxin reductase 1 cytoplasmic" protein_id=Seg618.2/GoldUCD/D3Y31